MTKTTRAMRILAALKAKTEIDYCGLFEAEVVSIIEKELA